MLKKLPDGKTWIVDRKPSKIEVFIADNPKRKYLYKKTCYIVSSKTGHIELKQS